MATGTLAWKPLGRIGRGWEVPLSDIVVVNPDGVVAPMLEIVTQSHERHTLMLVGRRWQPVWEGWSGADEVIRTVRAAVGAAQNDRPA
jgi:hypothetical protein